jgi:hypothetical protein
MFDTAEINFKGWGPPMCLSIFNLRFTKDKRALGIIYEAPHTAPPRSTNSTYHIALTSLPSRQPIAELFISLYILLHNKKCTLAFVSQTDMLKGVCAILLRLYTSTEHLKRVYASLGPLLKICYFT